MEVIKNEEHNALQIAYKGVCTLGLTHARLIAKDCTLTYKILRRIRDGRLGNRGTDEYYLQKFVRIIDEEYRLRIRNGGEDATQILRMERDILLAAMK